MADHDTPSQTAADVHASRREISTHDELAVVHGQGEDLTIEPGRVADILVSQ
jgi:hypothetical protein